MNNLILTTLILIFSQFALAQRTLEQKDRADVLTHYNLEQTQLGLKGYDPVAYFTVDRAIPGNQSISTNYGGVVYYFSSQENLNEFIANPLKYEPTYGGWCAWAMANNAYADIDPKLYTRNGDRMHFFISRGAKARFDAQLQRREEAADNFWFSETGEAPRGIQ